MPLQEEATHDWEFFVKDVNKGDMKLYTEKIHVILHETFKNPKRGKYLWRHLQQKMITLFSDFQLS